MQKPKAADFDNEQDYLNNWAGWQAQSGSWSEPAPTDWKAPVVTPQPDGMLTNTTTPTEDTYTAPPTDYVPEYVQPKTTQVEDLFSNELGSSTEADDPFAIDVESEDTYTAPPADYVPEYTAPVAAATGYREDGDVSSSPEVLVETATGYREDGDVSSSPEVSEETDLFSDYSRLTTGNQTIDASYSDDPATYLSTTDASGLPFMEYTPEMMESVTFDDPSRLGDYTNFGGRLISGDSEEYEAAFTFNNLLSRGIDEQTALDWFDNDGTAAGANKILSDTYFEKQDAVISELNNSIELDNNAKFKSQYNGLDFEGKIGFLHDQLKQENITQEQYEQLWRDEWNASQEGSDNPNYIVQIDAPRDWDAGQGAGIYQDEYSPKYKAGDKIWVTTDGTEILGVVRTNTYTPNEVNADRKLQYYDNIGPLTENIPDQSTWMDVRESVLKPGLRTAIAAATGGASEQLYSAVRLATGETLHGSDYANLVIGGLEMTGVITPPVTTTDAAGLTTTTAGTGLNIGGLNLSYEATTSLINGLGEKNPVAVMTSLMGDKFPDTLKSLGIPATLVDDPDFMKAFNKGLNVALDGGKLEDVLTESIEKYIKEGGSFGDLLEGDYDVSMFDGLGDVLEPFMDVLKEVAGEAEDLLKPVADLIADAAKPIIKTADDILDATGDVIGDTVDVLADAADPIINTADDILDATGDVIGDTVDVLADAADPIIKTADDILDATGDVIGDTVDVVADTFEPVVDAADDIIDATGDTLEDLADALPDVPDVPDVPLPDVPLPDVPLPDLNLNLPSMGMLSGTRTTDSLFGKDLFKFKTKIGVSPQEQLMQAPQRKQQKQEYDNLFEDPFASTFNFKV